MNERNHARQKIDDLDLEIINLLEQDGRQPNTELAKKLNSSEATIRKRIKRLIDEGFIRVIAVRNRSMLGYWTDGNIRLTVDTRKTKEIIEELRSLKGLWYIAHLTGAADFDLEFSVRSQSQLKTLLEEVNAIDGVLRTEVSIRLELIKQSL
ncbi:Lrp/AsnC family transcriptional regulator [Desulforhopalus singaporensis]|uniref:Lrp/AsnC family transcriptional regulator, regulator for asnA, asnC and gidA n=1 Tax=Desulforhopalus singaporensis TaxID=91360 RepID=A0A1H0TJJ2_9BACT|nr:winged helix-turn-helix transcriptional regulator [Desulforhopalus singaporensis]SDP53840.1 Lrp/AsnC family transcriptional regulator, regulator for asnA, asnC and gidA [Desulforhopalus singaporensis]